MTSRLAAEMRWSAFITMRSFSVRKPISFASRALVAVLARAICSKAFWRKGSGGVSGATWSGGEKAAGHLLGASSGRDQADPDLDEAHVRLAGCYDAV